MPNHLPRTQSLYLRKHADNPINWWYWCDEALHLAKEEQKPIFLSIGYSSCHWCTVMEGEAFNNAEIAEYMNAKFLPIKIDREERPDLDSIYMQALQMMTGQGGWPLNVFLTPEDLVPFYGGTYFPVEPRYGRPGFLQVLQAVYRFYEIEKEKLAAFKAEIFSHLQGSVVLPTGELDSLNREVLERGMQVNTAVLMPNHPGNPNFPMMPYTNLALQSVRFNLEGKYNAKELCEQRGEDLVLGGIYDHVGGGFHRYTVDATWTVPHFEKMLYDNGQILEYLANLWSLGIKEPALERAISGTVKWLSREMVSLEGYFYAAQDADSFITPTDREPEEGSFYVWSYDELEKCLAPEELEEMVREFTVTTQGNFEGNNVLQRYRRGELSSNLTTALDKLFKIRYGKTPVEISLFSPAKNNSEAKEIKWAGRIPPVTDTKGIVAWNSLVISGLARVYAVFGERQCWDLATCAADFILEKQWVEGRLYRLNYDGKKAIFAQSEDYALLIKALLDLYASAPNIDKYLDAAIKLQEEFDELLWNFEIGGYYNSAIDSEKELLIRERSYIDNAIPAPNGIAISSLVRLALLTENLEYMDKAERAIQSFAAVALQAPQACPSLFAALDWYLHGSLVKTNAENMQLLVGMYLPTTVYKIVEDLPPDCFGMVCQGLSCLEPARDLEELLEQL
jgi:hypothetical protein